MHFIGDMLAQETLPESLIERCLDVLYEITPSERDLIRIVVEVVIELRDDDMDSGLKDMTTVCLFYFLAISV
jgi:condensin complex subunit 3